MRIGSKMSLRQGMSELVDTLSLRLCALLLLPSTLTIEKRGAPTNYAFDVLDNEYKDGLICVQLGATTLRRAYGATCTTP